MIQPYPGEAPVGFAAGPLDRLAERRLDGEWQRAQLEAPETRFVPVWRYRVPIQGRAVGWWRAAQVSSAASPPVFLGCQNGHSVYAVDVSAVAEDEIRALAAPGRFVDLRGAAPMLNANDAAVLAYARAMVYWHRQHQFCGRCGGPTQVTAAGHVRHCDPCNAEHYPRSDPSMLVLVTADERCLLGRQASWPNGVWSTLAGFVEPGESGEDAVVREVWEEARIQVTGTRYFASQPWPFPASILMGFHASGIADTPATEQDELEAADWFEREQIAAGLRAGQIYLPPPVTLSYRLIEHWFDQGQDSHLRELISPHSPRT